MNTESKVLVVTGSSQGLGEGFVKAYRERGWRVSEMRVRSSSPKILTISPSLATLVTRR